MAIDKTASGVLTRLKAEIPSKYNTDEGSVLYDILAAAAIEFESAYSNIDSQISKNLISEASGDDLDRLLAQMGYTRKQATYADGNVTVTGTDGAVVPVGTLVARGRVLYETTTEMTVSAGSAVVPIRAKYPGESGNAPAETVNYFPVMPENLLSVINLTPISGGTDEETDNDFRERYIYFLNHPVTSGNVYEFEQWALEVDGVGAAKCYGIWNGPGTVKVVIATSAMEPASDELVAAVAAHIEQQRLIGPEVTVVSAESVSVNVSAKLIVDGSFSLSAAKDAFTEELTAYIKNVGFSGGLIPYTMVGSILQSLPGVSYYTNYTLNGKTENISVNEGQIAVIGTISLTGGD